MKSYYRVMLGKGSSHAPAAFAGGFIGTDFDLQQDLSKHLPDEWRAFNRRFIPVYMAQHPQLSKISAGLAMGALWTVSKGIKIGDLVLCPDGTGRYRVGEVTGDYQYAPGQPLQHRRAVRWIDRTIDRAAMSDALRRSAGSTGTVAEITKYGPEIEVLIGGAPSMPGIVATSPEIEDPTAFAMEKHLEDFLVQNWKSTDLGREYDIYQESGELVGQQYETDTGPMDILAISKDRTRLMVVELKKGRASDAVVGQVLRYMGYVQDELAEEGQTVHGTIIALEDDPRLRRALSMVPSVGMYLYQVSFKLVKPDECATSR